MYFIGSKVRETHFDLPPSPRRRADYYPRRNPFRRCSLDLSAVSLRFVGSTWFRMFSGKSYETDVGTALSVSLLFHFSRFTANLCDGFGQVFPKQFCDVPRGA